MDIDGTMAMSDDLHFEAFKLALQKIGYNDGKPITVDFYKEKIAGISVKGVATQLLSDFSEDEREKFSNEKPAIFREMAGRELRAVPGIKEFLDMATAQGLPKVAVTNAPLESAKFMLECLGIDSHFKDLICGDECEHAKPHPDPYLAGLRKLGEPAKSVLAFEDSPAGVKAALAAGLGVVALTTSQSEAALQEAGAICAVADYHEAMQLIKQQS